MRYLLLIFIALPFIFVNGQNLDLPTQKFDIKKIDSKQLYDKLSNPSKANFTLELEGYKLHLTPSNILSPNYKCVNEHGISTGDSENRAIPFRGYTAKGEKVTLTIAPGFIYASIGLGDDEILIEPTSHFGKTFDANDEYLVYKASEIKKVERSCGSNTLHELGKKQSQTIPQKSFVDLCFEVEYAVCHDYGMVSQLGSNTAVENFGIANTNEMNSVYDTEFADEVRFVISGQYISSCSTCDPWSSSTNISTVLDDFTLWGQNSLASSPINIAHDDATLWSARDFNGGTVGLAWLGVVCTNNKYNVCENLESVTFNRRLVAHEVGHNFNANHVANGFVMSTSVNNASDNWNSTSVTSVQNHYLAANCLASCVPNQVLVNWGNTSQIVDENNGSGATGSCNSPFVDVNIPITINADPTSSVVVNISINSGNTTASIDDYTLNTAQVTFTNGGSLTHNVTIRVLDDVLEESSEDIYLDFSVSSGPAANGAATSTVLTIVDNGDNITTAASVPYTYNTGNFSVQLPFAGTNPSFRTRFLLTPAILASIGITAGTLNQIDLSVLQKNSTGSYNNFKIGLANHAGTTLPNTFISTTNVFDNNVTTVVDWNTFVFDTPFVWDGTSSLYFDMCYDNSTPGGDDFIRINTAAGIYLQYVTSFSNPICTGTVFGASGFGAIPWFRLYKQEGAVIASNVTPSPEKGNIKVGETGHYFDSNNELILSLTNTGSVDIGCADVSISTAGNGRSLLLGSTDLFTDKTFEVDAPGNASYDITLYYTTAELAVWGGNNTSLNVVKSDVALATSIESDLTVVTPTTVQTNVGLSGGISYQASFTGFSYFALTDKDPTPEGPVLNAIGDLAIGASQEGFIFTSPSGLQFQVRELSSGNLVAASAVGAPIEATLTGSDFYLNSNQSAFLVKPNSGNSYSQYRIVNGVLSHSVVNTLPMPNIQLLTGNLLIANPGSGIVMKGSSGNCFKMSVSDLGVINITPATCP